jgi:hypothetical protein
MSERVLHLYECKYCDKRDKHYDLCPMEGTMQINPIVGGTEDESILKLEILSEV